MFFKFPIRTIVQEEHEGTSLPYNNIRHEMYSLYKVMNRAGANRESLLPYAQAPMKKKSTENATLMSARHYESENARRDASAQASHPVYHMHVGKQGSRGIICGKQSGQTQCPYSYMFAEPFTHFPSSYVFYSLSLFPNKSS